MGPPLSPSHTVAFHWETQLLLSVNRLENRFITTPIDVLLNGCLYDYYCRIVVQIGGGGGHYVPHLSHYVTPFGSLYAPLVSLCTPVESLYVPIGLSYTPLKLLMTTIYMSKL